ncbi:unnamed protein product [Dibothriocephalus latus]|uniref:Uncharacterized protein n=1 Tax=Dibothriocephalus latus TaxID=60516 RepID=A0A3P7P7R1_DIBLA|nr:unnamed protein product [Dibothriocephalus latus]
MASLLTMFYLVYLLECWNCQTRQAAHVLNATLQTCAYDRVITQVRQCFLDAKAVGGWEDRSPAICWTIDKPAIRVTFSKEFAFASDAWRLRYEKQRRSFERLQENEDDFLEIKEGNVSVKLLAAINPLSQILKCNRPGSTSAF